MCLCSVLMRAVGFLEGFLTAPAIFDYAFNMRAWLQDQVNDTQAVSRWLTAQDQWTRAQVTSYVALWWRTVGLLTSQADGVMAGYQAFLAEQVDEAAAYGMQELNKR
jgi:hypothetical protein